MDVEAGLIHYLKKQSITSSYKHVGHEHKQNMRNKNQRSVRDLLNLRLICTIFVGAQEVRGGQVITLHLS